MKQYKYIVWVGGTPNYFDNHTDAVCEKLEWLYKGYDDVHIEEVESDNMPKFLDKIFNKDFIENVLIQKDQMDINFKDDSFFVGQSDIKAVENKGWAFDSISTHGNSGISLLFTKK